MELFDAITVLCWSVCAFQSWHDVKNGQA